MEPTPITSSSELSPALAPLAWWLGDWRGEVSSEHWVAAGGALFGVALNKDGTYEVMIVDDAAGPGPADGVRRFYGMPNGASPVEFRERRIGEGVAAFANDEHDFPKQIEYRKAPPGLVATISGDGKQIAATFERGSLPRAHALEAADRTFAEDVAKRGIDGWIAAFDERGAMVSAGKRVEGHAAVGETMRDLLASGTLAWAPIASGASGDLGFTVGKATFTGKESWRSAYVTIWKRQPDGGWKVWFDTGRIVNE